jgi:hypothetical protein
MKQVMFRFISDCTNGQQVFVHQYMGFSRRFLATSGQYDTAQLQHPTIPMTKHTEAKNWIFQDCSGENQMTEIPSSPSFSIIRSIQRFEISGCILRQSLPMPAPPPKRHYKTGWRRLAKRICELQVKSVDEGKEQISNVEAIYF